MTEPDSNAAKSESNPTEDWMEPTPEQRLSNRPLLNVQRLADDLRDDFSQISLFRVGKARAPNEQEAIKSVLFVNYVGPTEETPLFSYALLLTRRLTHPVMAEWLKDPGNQKRLSTLFHAANRPAPHEDEKLFSKWIEEGSEKSLARAHSLLIESIEAIRYSGTVSQLLEEIRKDNPGQEWWWIHYKPDVTPVPGRIGELSVWSWKRGSSFERDPELIHDEKKPFNVPLFCHAGYGGEGLNKLLLRFIDPFMLGGEPQLGADDGFPYQKEDGEFRALAVPVYDFLDVGEPTPSGSLLGWAYLMVDPTFAPCPLGRGELGIRFGLRNFARELRDYQTMGVLESPWDVDSPLKFVAKHIHQCTGWEHDKLFALKKLPSDAKEVLNRDYHAFLNQSNEEIQHYRPENVCSGSNQPKWLVIRIPASTGTRERKSEEPILFLKRKEATTLAGLPAKRLQAYGDSVVETARWIYDDAKLRQAERELAESEGQQSGFLASAHDYSKDIGSVLLRLERFKEDLDRTSKSIMDKAKQVAAMAAPTSELGSSILEDLRSWTPPYLDDSFANVRFTNAHLQTQTRGVLIDEPTECVARLERGTLRDIYEIVRILVWHPIPFPKLKEKESEYIQFAPEKIHHPSTWWNLFMFDLDPSSGSEALRTLLGDRLRHLILDEKIDEPSFTRRFHIPRICPGIPFDDPRSILWPDTDPSRWKDVNGLLPLFVFTMRFAFQCAWAKTLLEEPALPLGIKIEANASQHRKYEMFISFPSPSNEADFSFDKLPYAGEWISQIRHYTDRQTAPWKVDSETNSVTPSLTEGGNVITIRIGASI